MELDEAKTFVDQKTGRVVSVIDHFQQAGVEFVANRFDFEGGGRHVPALVWGKDGGRHLFRGQAFAGLQGLIRCQLAAQELKEMG